MTTATVHKSAISLWLIHVNEEKVNVSNVLNIFIIYRYYHIYSMICTCSDLTSYRLAGSHVNNNTHRISAGKEINSCVREKQRLHRYSLRRKSTWY